LPDGHSIQAFGVAVQYVLVVALMFAAVAIHKLTFL
jgi:hypothetical protein